MKMMMFRKYAMRAGVVAVCSAALYAVPMMAQGGGGGRYTRMTPAMRADAIDKAVTLTPEQKTKITAIYTTDEAKMTALRSAQDPDMRTKMMAIRTSENDQIKAILTTDQNTKYDAYLAARRQRFQRGGGGGAGGAAPAQQ